MKIIYIVLTVLAIASERRTLAFVPCHLLLGSRPLDSFLCLSLIFQKNTSKNNDSHNILFCRFSVGSTLITYTEKLLEGSCDRSLIKDARNKMIDNDLTTRELQITGKNEMTKWYDLLESRPALNGESTRISCKNEITHKPENNEVVCRNGVVQIDLAKMKCVRKACKKPTLAADVQIVNFQEKNLHTRFNSDSVSEGKLVIEIKKEFFAPKPSGKMDEAAKTWEYVCQGSETWDISLGNPPNIDKERPSCPEIELPEGNSKAGTWNVSFTT